MGCTVAINPQLIAESRNYKPVAGVMHDHWFYLLAHIYGHVFFDKEPSMTYRIHQNNDTGIPNYLKIASTLEVSTLKNHFKRYITRTKMLFDFVLLQSTPIERTSENSMHLYAINSKFMARFMMLKHRKELSVNRWKEISLVFLILFGVFKKDH
jgi:hypothetical protein